MVQTFGLPRHTFGTNVSPKRRHTHQPGFVAGYLPAIERIDALAALAGALHRSGSWRSQYSHRSAWRVNQTVPKMRTDPVAQAFRPAWGGRLSRLALPAEPIRDQFLHASVSEHRQRRGRSPKPRVLSERQRRYSLSFFSRPLRRTTYRTPNTAKTANITTFKSTTTS
jgi:hypothetical protein